MATEWFRAKEAAAYAKVAPITLKRAVRAGRLTAYHINDGRCVRYRREDIDQWLTGASAVKEQRS